ncbi:MAG: hypothetical protein JRI97_08935, partial [Deltaproteobacteria bacterium]|nr:hypothetical protein [Deltaproteobacteria bacterium]
MGLLEKSCREGGAARAVINGLAMELFPAHPVDSRPDYMASARTPPFASCLETTDETPPLTAPGLGRYEASLARFLFYSKAPAFWYVGPMGSGKTSTFRFLQKTLRAVPGLRLVHIDLRARPLPGRKKHGETMDSLRLWLCDFIMHVLHTSPRMQRPVSNLRRGPWQGPGEDLSPPDRLASAARLLLLSPGPGRVPSPGSSPGRTLLVLDSMDVLPPEFRHRAVQNLAGDLSEVNPRLKLVFCCRTLPPGREPAFPVLAHHPVCAEREIAARVGRFLENPHAWRMFRRLDASWQEEVLCRAQDLLHELCRPDSLVRSLLRSMAGQNLGAAHFVAANWLVAMNSAPHGKAEPREQEKPGEAARLLESLEENLAAWEGKAPGPKAERPEKAAEKLVRLVERLIVVECAPPAAQKTRAPALNA